jgi:hypothetical protein
MDADVNNQPCQCELCQPNWYMGSGGDVFEAQPAEQTARQVTLEELHTRKVMSRQVDELMPATG